ncbi:polyprenyl synthetase family protein [uncultured Bacteroides sp.]|uniref:polyprenyl synthetase family protein n=1 Tax=uncultured Bacteroides sp. TaxID=162156 RepID=UPI002AA880D2|nr:polyprenyl synthetase family protein [uncultured Bacteroides sp.]
MFAASELLDIVNTHLSKMDFDRSPRGLYEPIKYVLSIGGKRIRPVLMMMAYNLYKNNISEILSCAAGIEMYHNYTLLHDDLMDKADTRRGKKTVHKIWNDNVAILSGDAMLLLAYRHISDCPSEKQKEILDLFGFTALEICEGQQLDMEFELRDDVSEVEYLEMIRLKTAVLLAASLKIGALLGGASEKDADLLYDVGMNLGVAFQLKDDLLDIYGNPVIFGKKIGGDILCNKKTYILIKALKLANANQSFELMEWINAVSYDPEEKIANMTRIYTELGLKTICERKMEIYYQQASDSLARVQVAEDSKKMLMAMIDNLMFREM